jgi:hypothetical protein
MSAFGESICIAVYGKSIFEFPHYGIPPAPAMTEQKKLEVLLQTWDLEQDIVSLATRFGKDDPVAAYFRPRIDAVKEAYEKKDDAAFRQAVRLLVAYAQVK